MHFPTTDNQQPSNRRPYGAPRVMLDRDLAELYEVQTGILKRAVFRNVAMLSSVLNSPRAVQVNITIMRAFVRLRCILATHSDLARKLDELEKKYDAQFRVVFDAMRELMNPPEPPGKPIGFGVHERKVNYRVATKKNTAKNRGWVVPAPDEVTGQDSQVF